MIHNYKAAGHKNEICIPKWDRNFEILVFEKSKISWNIKKVS